MMVYFWEWLTERLIQVDWPRGNKNAENENANNQRGCKSHLVNTKQRKVNFSFP